MIEVVVVVAGAMTVTDTARGTVDTTGRTGIAGEDMGGTEIPSTRRIEIDTKIDRATRAVTRDESYLNCTTTMPNPTSVTQATVALEYASLRNKDHCPLGMYVVPAAQSLLCWDSVFFVHRGASSILSLPIHPLTALGRSGHYAGAILKFHINFPWDYPEHPPVVQFVTDIFHPLIGPDGTLSMAPRFRPWR